MTVFSNNKQWFRIVQNCEKANQTNALVFEFIMVCKGESLQPSFSNVHWKLPSLQWMSQYTIIIQVTINVFYFWTWSITNLCLLPDFIEFHFCIICREKTNWYICWLYSAYILYGPAFWWSSCRRFKSANYIEWYGAGLYRSNRHSGLFVQHLIKLYS